MFRFLCTCALGVTPLMGCSEGGDRCDVGAFELQPDGNGQIAGTGGMAGTGGSAGTSGQVFSCTEDGIRDAIAEGGGPHTFACDGQTTVVTEAEIVIDNDAVLDGEGNLTVDGNEDHRVFFVNEGVTAELIGLTVTRGHLGLGEINERDLHGAGIMNEGVLTLTNTTVTECLARFVSGQFTPSGRHGGRGGGIHNTIDGTMTLTSSTVSNSEAGSYGGGIDNDGVMTIRGSTVSGSSSMLQGGGIASLGTLTVTNSRVSGNTAGGAGGIDNTGTLTLTSSVVSNNAADVNAGIGNYGTAMLMNTTVSGNVADNGGGGISNGTWGVVTLVNSTLSGNTAGFGGGIINHGSAELTNTLVDNDCWGTITSKGHNIESPGDTCGFDQPSDQVEVDAGDLKLGPLQDNGGPTETHALGESSVAIDVIPEADCVDADGKPLTTDQRGEPRPK